jgi:hypothetical protein
MARAAQRALPPNKQLERSYVGAGAPQVRHFIMHMRRAGQVSAPPLNCGVSRHGRVALEFQVNGPKDP